MTSQEHRLLPEQGPWLNTALTGSHPILYPRSPAEQEAAALLIREQINDKRWDRHTAKVSYCLTSGIVGIIIGFIAATIFFEYFGLLKE